MKEEFEKVINETFKKALTEKDKIKTREILAEFNKKAKENLSIAEYRIHLLGELYEFYSQF